MGCISLVPDEKDQLMWKLSSVPTKTAPGPPPSVHRTDHKTTRVKWLPHSINLTHWSEQV